MDESSKAKRSLNGLSLKATEKQKLEEKVINKKEWKRARRVSLDEQRDDGGDKQGELNALELCLHATVLGENVPVEVVKAKAAIMWKVEKKVDIQSIGNGFFFITFESKDDYNLVLDKGPWLVNERYLVFMKWKLGFNPLKACIEEANVWVRLLPHLPLEFSTKKHLSHVLRDVGEVVKLDENTEKYPTLFPRVCVTINLTKQLVLEIPITAGGRDSTINVMYENLDDELCIGCGYVGHKPYNCPDIILDEG
uniref:DUF4283 domain-containing protein n=1 Tax=Nelumbo nucifera TaxID=4432 RepID=A0A822Y0V0_NELNU|nr:TPA_asm: hypothetical protein HUJ06_026363 [Nelumbo nucifera]